VEDRCFQYETCGIDRLLHLIELPPVKPFIRRRRRFAICCEHCRAKTPAPLPAFTVGTPFGSRIHALAIYLKTHQALSYERLQQAFSDLFGLTISQGALMNMFARTVRAFEEKAESFMKTMKVEAVYPMASPGPSYHRWRRSSDTEAEASNSPCPADGAQCIPARPRRTTPVQLDPWQVWKIAFDHFKRLVRFHGMRSHGRLDH
jgi:hypothetical protein